MSTDLIGTEDGEASDGFGGDCEESGVDTGVVVLEHVRTDRDPLIAVLLAKCLPVDVAELGLRNYLLKQQNHVFISIRVAPDWTD